MDNSQSSYEFHKRIEPPGAFCRREWRAIAAFGGAACLLMLVGVVVLDPAFFYPRLQTDPLNYWLKAKSLIEDGHTSARWAVNVDPFPYAAMPGVLRAPLILAFDDFDRQLRAIQLTNIPIVAAVAVLSAYVVSWAQPVRRHRWVVGAAFAFTLLSPVWTHNVFLPLVDAPYALATLGAVVLSIELVCRERPIRHQLRLGGALAVVFLLAFLLRYTAPALVVFIGVLLRGRQKAKQADSRPIVIAAAACIVLLTGLAWLNSDAIFGRYLREPLFFFENSSGKGIALNLLGAAIPAQIIPSFIQGFVVPPVGELTKTNFFATARDTAWLAAGLTISIVTLVGMWRARSRFLPEILMVLAPLPVLALMLPSTARYLMTYQAFFWLFFLAGAATLSHRLAPRIPAAMGNGKAAGLAIAVVLIMVLGIRSWRFAGTAAEQKFAVGVTSAPAYIDDVETIFRSLRNYLETLPRERTLLVSEKGSMGRWRVIAGRDYYEPDSALTQVTSDKEVYLVIECGAMEGCQRWDWHRRQVEQRVSRYGNFTLDSVFAVTRPRARAHVFRIRSAL